MKNGDRVYWKNDPEQRPWFVMQAREDSQFVRIIANPKLYPKTDMHSVPKGTLSETPFTIEVEGTERPEQVELVCTPQPASSSPTTSPRATSAMHPDRYLPPAPPSRPKKVVKPAIKVPGGLDLNGLKAFAASLGLGSHHMAEIHRIWDGPAPNKPMRTMRVHNYIKNAYKQLED